MDGFIKKELINNQDYLLYSIYSSYEMLGFFGEYKGYSIRDIANKIASSKDLLSLVSTENIFNLLSVELAKENRHFVINEVVNRYDSGENIFSGSNIEYEHIFGRLKTNSFSMPSFSSEFIDRLRNDTREKLSLIKDEEIKNILMSTNIPTVMNYFNVYEKGFLTEEKLSFIKALYKKNPNILLNFNFNILLDSTFGLDSDFLMEIAPYNNLCAKLISITKEYNMINALQKIIDTIKNDSLQTRLEVLEKVINYCFENYESVSVFSVVDSKTLINYAISGYYSYGAKPKDKLIENNYDNIFYESKGISDMKNIILNKYFSMSKTEAEKFLKNNYQNINDIKEYDEYSSIKDLLLYINMVIECSSERKLKSIFESCPYNFSAYQITKLKNDIRSAYAKTFTGKLRNTAGAIQNIQNNFQSENMNVTLEQEVYDKYKKEDITLKDLANIDYPTYDYYNEKKIDIIPIDRDINFIVTSTDTGFIEDKNLENNSFVTTFTNTKDKVINKLSTTYIDDNNIGVAPLNSNGVYYGYTNIPNDYINIMNSKDANSHIRNFAFSSSKEELFGAKSFSSSVRQVYGEVVIRKTNPDYVILFSDAPTDIIVNSYKAASEWNIPIIYINKIKVMKNQIGNIEELLELFKISPSVELFEEILSTYESNVAGFLLNRNDNEEDKSYTMNIDNTKYSELLKYGEVITNLFNNYISSIDSEDIYHVLHGIIEKELEKYNNQSTMLSKTSSIIDLNLLKNTIDMKIEENNSKKL